MCFFFLDSDTPLNTTVASRGHCGDSAASYLVSCEGRLKLIVDNDGGAEVPGHPRCTVGGYSAR